LEQAQHKGNRGWQALLVLIVALTLTALSTWYVWSRVDREDRLRFERDARSIDNAIDTRMDLYVTSLRGASALFAASNEVEASEFHNYIERVGIATHYPGVQGIGFAMRVSAADLATTQQRMRSQPGFEKFEVYPAGPRAEYYPVVYLEPQDRRNQVAVGYDIFTEPRRREAMERARDEGAPAASEMLTLVQEIDHEKQAGILLCVPVYQGAVIPDTVQERREKITGFVYSPFRAGDLLTTILKEENANGLRLEVYDSRSEDPARLLFSSEPARRAARFSSVRQIDVEGRIWTLVSETTPAFKAGEGFIGVLGVAVVGTALSLLLFQIVQTHAKARVAAEAATARIRVSEGRLRRLVDANLVGVIITHLDGTIIDGNDEFLRMTGYSREDLNAGRLDWKTMTPPDHRHLTAWVVEQMKLNGKCPPYEKEYFRKDGSRLPVLIGVALTDPPRQDQYIAFVVDLTEQKRVSGELQHAKEQAEAASAAKDQFIAVLSHELRTPLTPVLLMVGAMEQDESLPEEARDSLGMVRRNVELEARLIDDLLDLTRISKGKVRFQWEAVDVHEVIPAAVRVASEDVLLADKGVNVVLELSARHHIVRGDAARLQQIVWNLVKNAMKFTPPGGRIDVRTEDADDALRISVKDTGAGIEPALLPKIFNAFEQGDGPVTRLFGGLGLGLAISKSLVEGHKGKIMATSQGADRGAEFVIELPTIAAPANEPIEANILPTMKRREPVRLLLVEDHSDTARALARLLRREGYQVETAGSVAEAVLVGSRGKFDVLVSDLGLPDGSGLEILPRLRNGGGQSAGLPGIALTGFGMDEDVRRTMEAGYVEHLTKPVDLKMLKETIERVTAAVEIL